MDHEHDQLADVVGGKCKRGNWERLRAPDHTVMALRQPNHPTGQIILLQTSSISTSHTVGTTDNMLLLCLFCIFDGLVNVQGMSKTELM